MLTECISGKAQQMPFGLNSMIELKQYNTRSSLSDVVVIILGCSTVAFSERYTVLLGDCCIYKKRHFSMLR
jgi:hypothetical protein